MRILLLLAFLTGASAEAAEISRHQSSPVSGKPWALGVFDSTNVTNGQSLSALFATEKDWVQTFAGINHVKNHVEFVLGGIYKFTVAGDRRAGFHIGPGFSLGSFDLGREGKFGASIFGAAGGHYTLFDRLILSVDAGPILTIISDNTDFRLSPFGDTLGLSLHYLF